MAVAANIPPLVFAKQVIGAGADADREIGKAVLRYLALVTGQTTGHLAGGLLHILPATVAESEANLIENVTLIDGRFLASCSGYDAEGRTNALLQFVPLAWPPMRVRISGGHGAWRMSPAARNIVAASTIAAGNAPSPCPHSARERPTLCRAVPSAIRSLQQFRLLPSRSLRRQTALLGVLLYLATRVLADKAVSASEGVGA